MKREGASQADVFATSSRTVSVYVDDGRIKIADEKLDQGISVRALKGRKVGQASSTCVAEEDADRCGRSASKLADLAPPSRSFDRLPAPTAATLSPDNWDPRAAEIDGAGLSELARTIVSAAMDRGVKVPKGMIRAGSVHTLVRNSNGVDVSNRYTLVFSAFGSMADGPTPGEGLKDYTSPWLEGLDPVCVGASLAEQAKAASRATALPQPLKLPVLIAPGELGEMLDPLVGTSASADSVHKKRSAWTDKIGEAVASEAITVVDDPGDNRAVLSAPYDDEGVPTSRKTIIEKGVLSNFLYDSYNSSVSGKAPSGNGVRRWPQNSQYVFQNSVGAGHFNLVFQPGAKGQDALRSSFDQAVLIEKFSYPDVNPVSGAFALEIRLGHLLSGGTVERTFKHALLVGNMFDALKNVREVGRDVEVVRASILPTIAFEGMEVVGSSLSPDIKPAEPPPLLLEGELLQPRSFQEAPGL